MPANPKLKQINKSSPLRPLIDDLNHAIRNQSQIRPGSGFGMTRNSIVRSSQDYMVAFTGSGVGKAKLIDKDDASKGRVLGQGVVYEQTVTYDDDGNVSIVPAGPDDVTAIPCFNYSQFASVEPNTLVELQKRFGLWMVTWEECNPNADPGSDSGV